MLKRPVDLWRDRHNDGRLPSPQDSDSETLLSLGGQIALIEVESNPRRYRYRLVGTQITAAVGRSLTGRYFDTLYGDKYYRRMTARFEEIILSKTAIRTVGNMAHSEKP
ncbi:MAG: PAS domain-containing protein [Pseudomonadota bacterium]|nr:PAS domain-containing protein [Pseudomonadota bacterium]